MIRQRAGAPRALCDGVDWPRGKDSHGSARREWMKHADQGAGGQGDSWRRIYEALAKRIPQSTDTRRPRAGTPAEGSGAGVAGAQSTRALGAMECWRAAEVVRPNVGLYRDSPRVGGIGHDGRRQRPWAEWGDW